MRNFTLGIVITRTDRVVDAGLSSLHSSSTPITIIVEISDIGEGAIRQFVGDSSILLEPTGQTPIEIQGIACELNGKVGGQWVFLLLDIRFAKLPCSN